METTWRAWLAENPRAALYIVHGLGEHAGRYEKTAGALNRHGISVFSQDLPGFGRTSGRRGDVKSFDILLDTVTEGMRRIAQNVPEVPRFLLGHSLGGLLALAWVMGEKDGMRAPFINELRGVLLSSPALAIKQPPPPWQDRLARVLARIWPTLTLSTGISSRSLSHDPDIVHAYDRDPYVHRFISLRFYRQFQETMAWVRTHPEALPRHLPVLMMQAGWDQLVDSSALVQFYETVKRLRNASQDEEKELKLIIWEDWYHELLNEPESDQVIAAIVDFIFRHTNHYLNRHTKEN
ncbi:MAG: alpha/beta hydrolase [Candidatus Carbobacillus altaicus]|nr:alpha/beta hydrolase [Candidatus Carbobacillus altaicus]